MKEALDKGAELFRWEEKKKRSGQRTGNKVIGIGVGQGYHSAGTNGFDGLLRITPDGKLHVHTGVGNLGTYSHSATSRVAAEFLNYKWENVVIERGDSRDSSILIFRCRFTTSPMSPCACSTSMSAASSPARRR